MADDTTADEAPKAGAAAPPPGPPGPIPALNLIQGKPDAGAMEGIGVSGIKVAGGVIFEEYLPELKGPKLFQIYKTMQDDPVVTAMLQAITLILRAADWKIEPAGDDMMKPNLAANATAAERAASRTSNFASAAEKEAEFAKSLLDDLSHTWEDTVSEILSMLAYGWSFHEIVLKKRIGPEEEDGSKRSRYTDGRIGVRKLPIRSQDTLLRWAMQEDGGIAGMIQQPVTGGPTLFIPIERALLFRTTLRKGSPEGVSLLRSAYRPWYFKRHIEDMEAIGIERELAGLPVVRIPKKYLAANASSDDRAFRIQAEQMARDLKFNQQGGAVIPSDMWPNPDGSISSSPLVDITLLTTAGRRAIETDPVVKRYNRDITRAALADFLTLGDDKGSYALSENKSELFLRACETYLNQIAAVINLYLFPRLFRYNGISSDLLPKAKPGRITPVDLAKIGAYLQQISGAGAPLFPNQELSNYLADIAGMPQPPEDIGLFAQPGTRAGPGQIDPKTGEVINPDIDHATGLAQHEADALEADPAAGDPPIGKSWIEKFNPYHDERGRFTTGPATTLYNKHGADQHPTAEEIIEKNGAASKIQAIEEALMNEVPTNAQVSQGGHVLPNGEYTPARQALHNRILKGMFTDGAVKRAVPANGEAPTYTILGGRGGSGKSWLTGPDGPVDRNKALLIDSDHIKAQLPEYKGWNASMLHEESSYIMAKADERARQLGLNVIHDGTMKTEQQVLARVRKFSDAGYQLEGHYMFATPEAAANRSIGRFIRGGPKGRYVPPSVILANKRNERNFDRLRSRFRRWSVYDNMGKSPRLVARGGF